MVKVVEDELESSAEDAYSEVDEAHSENFPRWPFRVAAGGRTGPCCRSAFQSASLR